MEMKKGMTREELKKATKAIEKYDTYKRLLDSKCSKGRISILDDYHYTKATITVPIADIKVFADAHLKELEQQLIDLGVTL